jgi:hypothetical protein
LTPASQVFRGELQMPCNMLFGAPPPYKEWSTIDHVVNLVDHLYDIHNYACQHLKLATDWMKLITTDWPTAWATNCGSVTEPTWGGNRPSSNPHGKVHKK